MPLPNIRPSSQVVGNPFLNIDLLKLQGLNVVEGVVVKPTQEIAQIAALQQVVQQQRSTLNGAVFNNSNPTVISNLFATAVGINKPTINAAGPAGMTANAAAPTMGGNSAGLPTAANGSTLVKVIDLRANNHLNEVVRIIRSQNPDAQFDITDLTDSPNQVAVIRREIQEATAQARQGQRVYVNMSLDVDSDSAELQQLRNEITQATQAGVVVGIAAGNNGTQGTGSNAIGNFLIGMANNPNVFAVQTGTPGGTVVNGPGNVRVNGERSTSFATAKFIGLASEAGATNAQLRQFVNANNGLLDEGILRTSVRPTPAPGIAPLPGVSPSPVAGNPFAALFQQLAPLFQALQPLLQILSLFTRGAAFAR
jgi:hypothetical protein